MVKKEEKKKPYLDREEKKQGQKSHDEKKKGVAKGGLEEIDSLFEKKKRTKVESKMQNDKKKRRKVNNTQVQREGRTQGEWTDDGLGGKFNTEGFTGRVEDGCKIFKAHVLNKPNFGYSKDCPFDCDCCFI